jgi:hypothetical protein
MSNSSKSNESESVLLQKLTQTLLRKIKVVEASEPDFVADSPKGKILKAEIRETIAKEKF